MANHSVLVILGDTGPMRYTQSRFKKVHLNRVVIIGIVPLGIYATVTRRTPGNFRGLMLGLGELIRKLGLKS